MGSGSVEPGGYPKARQKIIISKTKKKDRKAAYSQNTEIACTQVFSDL